jgi:hypothetical protein
MEYRSKMRKSLKKSLDPSEYYKVKDIQQRQKSRNQVIKTISYRTAITTFIVFNLSVSLKYSFKSGIILSAILIGINFIFLGLEVLVLQKKIPKLRKFLQKTKASYIDIFCILLTMVLFLLMLFSLINQPRHWLKGFPDECESYDTSCARLGYKNQYRTNKIQNEFPLTFRNVTGLGDVIDEHIMNINSGWIVKYDNSVTNYTYLIYSISNGYGIL